MVCGFFCRCVKRVLLTETEITHFTTPKSSLLAHLLTNSILDPGPSSAALWNTVHLLKNLLLGRPTIIYQVEVERITKLADGDYLGYFLQEAEGTGFKRTWKTSLMAMLIAT